MDLINQGAVCRMCCTEATVPCPECSACLECAQDDCGTCLLRLEFIEQEQARYRALGVA